MRHQSTVLQTSFSPTAKGQLTRQIWHTVEWRHAKPELTGMASDNETCHARSLMKLLAIPLSNQKTVAKWLVLSPQANESLREFHVNTVYFV